jgi:hypothetical protein
VPAFLGKPPDSARAQHGQLGVWGVVADRLPIGQLGIARVEHPSGLAGEALVQDLAGALERPPTL